jgi:hypothetical protein
MAMGFVTVITTIVVTIAQANLFDAHRVGASEVNIFVEVGWASEAHAHVRLLVTNTAFLIAVVRAIVGTVASPCLRDASSIKAPESVRIALAWAQVLLMHVASVRKTGVFKDRSLGLRSSAVTANERRGTSSPPCL